MASKKPTHKTFRFTTLLEGRVIDGSVSFSPAPEPGIFTALAEFEAKRILNRMLIEEMEAGRL